MAMFARCRVCFESSLGPPRQGEDAEPETSWRRSSTEDHIIILVAAASAAVKNEQHLSDLPPGNWSAGDVSRWPSLVYLRLSLTDKSVINRRDTAPLGYPGSSSPKGRLRRSSPAAHPKGLSASRFSRSYECRSYTAVPPSLDVVQCLAGGQLGDAHARHVARRRPPEVVAGELHASSLPCPLDGLLSILHRACPAWARKLRPTVAPAPDRQGWVKADRNFERGFVK